jgi:hypothetical protein
LVGSFLGAWVLFPLVLLVLSTGCGLLVRRTAGSHLSAVLLVPVGFALLVVICAFATSYGWLAPAAGPLSAAAAAAGFAIEAAARPPRRPRPRLGLWIWPLVAALVAFAAVGGPVFLTGSVGWTGYTRIVDLAFQFDFSQHLADAGRVSPAKGDSSYNIVTAKLLGIGYPGGSQATLGALAKLTAVNVAWCYQAFLAFATAMGALAVFSALGRVTRNALMRCAGAAVAIQPNVLYGYALEAGIKELTTASLLLLLVALLLERLPGEGSRRSLVPHAVATSAAFATFSLGIAPWLGLLLVGALVVSLLRGPVRREVIASWTVYAVVAVVLAIPTIITASKLASVAGPAVGGVVDLGLGNLAAPVSRWSSAGVWLAADYRYPLAHPAASHVFDVIVIVLALLGVIASLVRRRWMLVVLGITAAIALNYFIEHSTAWIQFKSFTITAAFALTLAFVGAASLQMSRRRWLSGLGWLGALAVVGSVLYGNAKIYHDTTLAPGARYRELASIASRYAGRGPALDPYFDEYAEYFLRGVNGSTIVNPANLTFQVLPGVGSGGMSFGWDLNQLVPSFVQSFPLIIQPRSPIASRAPSNFDLIQQTRFFEVWRRDRPSNTILHHAPLSGLPHERTPRYCRLIVRWAAEAGPGAQIAYATGAAAIAANPRQGKHPDYWQPLGPSTLAALGAGRAQTSVSVPLPGRYGIWLQGSVGRAVGLDIDGRRLAGIAYEERYPGQFLLIASTTLSAGAHTLTLVRGNGTLHPGSGDPAGETSGRTLGALVLAREGERADRVYVASAARAAQICAAPVGYQWLEIVTPGGAPPAASPAPL